MKKSILILLLPFSLLVLTASRCNEPDLPAPEIMPCFTVVEENYRDPREPVQFQNCSQGATAYSWDFGDGTTATDGSPAHTYTRTGSFTVQLSAIDGDFVESTSQTIRVDYPRFKEFRILQMPVLNRHGVPFDQDGSGLELTMNFTKNTDHSALVYANASNVTLPYTLLVTSDESIEAWWWTVLLRSGSNYSDTVLFYSRNLSQLMDAPIEAVNLDSLKLEIVMEGVQ